MRFILAASAAAFLAACGQSQSLDADRLAITAPAADTKVLAVMSYADWCGSCKALDPKVEAVKAANAFEGVEFAILDYTKKDADAFFANADTLGVGDAMRAQFAETIKTGRLYLVSLDTGEVISTVDKTMDEATIATTISDAVAQS